MPEESKVDLVLNLEDLLCPMPIVKVSQAIKEIPIGGVIEAFATDPGVLADISAWCNNTGNELVETERQEGVIRFLVRRIK